MIRKVAIGLMAAVALMVAPLTTQASAVGDTAAASVDNDWVDPPADCDVSWPYTRWNHTGRFPCSTSVLRVIWPDGHHEYFGIGTNWQVYHITASTGGWKSLGGTASRPDLAYINSEGRPTIAVMNYNATHRIWCAQYISPNWVGWYACGAF